MKDTGMVCLIIGNMISVAQVICLILSCCAPTREKVYALQFAETTLCALATVFFGAWSGLTTLLIAMYRNWRTMENRFSLMDMIVTSVLTAVLGVMVNADGLAGLLPVIATLQLTAFNYYVEDVRLTKGGLLLNVALWGIYSFCIRNYVGAFGQMITLVIGLVSLLREGRRSVYSQCG